MSNIKIFVSYKDKHRIIKSNFITPIQTGRAIADEVFEDMIGDDTGDNISVLNNRFCETTAIYWAWKNFDKIDNPDYIGFMHYRRHFLFGDQNYVPNFYGLVKYPDLNNDYLKDNLDDDKIKKIVELYDLIIPKRIELELVNGVKNNYQQYKNSHNIKDLDKAFSLIINKYPEYEKYVNEYKSSNYAYFLDMFIMKKDIFFEYCNWLFSILFDLRYIIPPSSDSYQNRAIGFISERLTDIFFRKLYYEKYKIKELPVSFIENDTKEYNNTLFNIEKPIIPIVFSSSNNFAPYLSVCLQSIKENISSDYTYKLYILSRNINTEIRNILNKQISCDNIDIYFKNVEKLLKGYTPPKGLEHISIDTYSRFFIPEILYNYDKCLYLDGDILVKGDLAKLYHTPLDDKTLGASRCAVMSAWTNLDSKMKQYINDNVGICEIEKYLQAGVLIIDLKKMRENKDPEKLIKLAITQSWKFADQDVLNFYYKNNIKYIDMKWNYEYEHNDMKKAQFREMMPLNILNEYIAAKKNPLIVHYQGLRKPWFYPEEEFAIDWWEYARKSPFYEKIIANMIDYKNKNFNKNIKLYKKYKLKLFKYKILRNITFGNLRKKYIAKKNIYKDKLLETKKIIGNK